MSSIDIPFLGNLVICAMMLSAAYTFAVSLAAGRGRPHLLLSARRGTYATCALVALGVFLLAFAFQTHDFRIRYVARYSDRSMPWYYLVASLWGGQDGSLLWWTFLLCGYTTAATRWMKGRYVELQPWVLATLMSIVIFFCLLMLFAANPFATGAGVAPTDGEGLNPLLQNYWMAIHPPCLYMGFVGWSVPFSFVIAALVTGRTHDEWIVAVRRWALVAWLFLSIGLTLGMLWSYEELGWGGYWAWDPVENASFMPWLVGLAYLHSVMVQERYGMLKVWNVFLLCLTFFMTIFGTFLTRSGLIASVHAFARSDIGVWFVWYLAFVIIACTALVIWRLPKLKAEHKIDSLLSREFAFLLNNWILLGMMAFVLVATTFPLLSDWVRGEKVTVGPPFYNKWMVPLALVLLFLLGVGPLVAWRKATGRNLLRAFAKPFAFGMAVMLLHIFVGPLFGFPARVATDEIYDTFTGKVLAQLYAIAPLLSTTFSAFVMGTIVQEFWRGTRVRMRKGENAGRAFLTLMSRARRRYGGYIVHVGIVVMFLGWTGAAYDTEKEVTLRPGETVSVREYTLRYDGPRMEVDRNKRMIFADMTVLDHGEQIGRAAPAKFIYRSHPEMPTTEVSIRSRPADDLYVIMSTVDPQTKRATFRIIVHPLVFWIWFGAGILVFGTFLAMLPSIGELLGEDRGRRIGARARSAAGTTALLLLFAAALGLSPGTAQAQANGDGMGSLMAGTVVIHDPTERKLFERLLCQCGDCQTEPLTTCNCSWAKRHRAMLRAKLAAGETVPQIIAEYRAEYGDAAISVPSDQGLDRALWAVPLGGIVLAAGGIVLIGRRWKRGGKAAEPGDGAETPAGPGDRWNDALEEELRRMEGE